MDKLEQYRSAIKNILSEYYEITIAQSGATEGFEASDRLAFDEKHDQYLWFRFGWHEKKRIQHIIIYLCIKNGKIWVEEDATNLCVVDDLLSAGIPQSDIVLGFHHPKKRPYSSARIGNAVDCVVFPVCIYYFQRAVYLCGYGESQTREKFGKCSVMKW